jgi:LAO/AO transport system kinase
LKNLIESAMGGEVTAIARLITVAEAGGDAALQVQAEVFPRTGKAHLVGITGPAGVGKSTLISALATRISEAGRSVAVVACDPSSPNTGGALLGDRIRMSSLVSDSKVYIRSIATRASSGGIPLAAFRAADILDAAGYDTVIIETVGTGQNQIDIMQAVHTVIALSAPGLGDDIQAMKSGLLEVADIHAISKSDMPGAKTTLNEIENALHMRREREIDQGNGASNWMPPVLPVAAIVGKGVGEGVGELLDAIRAHNNFLAEADNLQRRCQRMFGARVYREAANQLAQSFREASASNITAAVSKVVQRELTPTQAATEILGAQSLFKR